MASVWTEPRVSKTHLQAHRSQEHNPRTCRCDKSWVVVWRDPNDPTHKRKSSKGGFPTRPKAEEFASEKTVEINSGGYVPEVQRRETLGTWLVSVIEGVGMDRQVAARLVGTWNKWGQPRIGHVQLGRLTRQMLSQFFVEIEEAGAGNGTRFHLHKALSRALRQAHFDGILIRNPLLGVPTPKVGKRRVQLYPLSVVKAMADKIERRYRCFPIIAADAGLRLGEIAGLRVENIDWATGSVLIEGSVKRYTGEGLVYKDPKTEGSVRPVQLSAFALTAIREHLAEFGPHADGFVFKTGRGGLVESGTFKSAWTKAREAVGLPALHFHDLRHVSGSWAYAEGNKDTAVIAQRMGHSERMFKNVYLTLSAEAQRPIADLMDRLWVDHQEQVPVLVPAVSE